MVVAQLVNILETIELYTLKGGFLWCVNYSSTMET